jgi:hypothetical protein
MFGPPGTPWEHVILYTGPIESDEGGKKSGLPVGVTTIKSVALKGGLLESEPSECVISVVSGWSLPKSIWAPRPHLSDSKDFYDAQRVMKRAFNLDWGRCMKKPSFTKWLTKVIEKSGSTFEEEVKEIKQEIWEDYPTIAASFDFYAVCSGGNGFIVKLNAYNDFLGDCEIPDKNMSSTSKALDTVFIIANLEDGLDAQESKSNDDKALMRFEWVEVIVRIAIAKYYDSGNVTDLSECVDHLCKQNIQPHLEDLARHVRNDFRRHRLYNEPVDTLLKSYNRMLAYIFKKYCKMKSGTKETVMNMAEWTRFLMDMGVLDADFTKREGRVCFTLSKVREHV